VRRLIILALLLGSMQLIFPLGAQGQGSQALLSFGFLILAAYTVGELAKAVRLPRIVGYLAAGVAFGPYGLGTVTAAGVERLAPVSQLAIALIAFLAGAELRWGEVRDRMAWENGERADVYLGPVMITLFTRAIYEDAVDLPDEGFLHPALFTDDLDAELAGHTVVWGPAVVEGTFGKRRIAFVEAPGGIRLEFMEQLDS